MTITDEKNHRNYWYNVIDGALFGTAMAVVPATLVLPAYVRHYTDSNFLINLIQALFVLGVTAPQIFMARHIENLRYKKKLMMTTAIIQRIPWLVMALVAVIPFGKESPWPLVVFFFSYALFSFSMGVNIPVWLDMIGKLIPKASRGRLMAMRHMLGLLFGTAGAALARSILLYLPFPYSYSLLFLLFFLLTSLSLIWLSKLEEHPSTITKSKTSFLKYLKQIPKVLRSDRNFVRHIFGMILLALASMQGGLIASYGIDKFQLSQREDVLATISLIASLFGAATIYPFGWLGDQIGHKINLLLSGLLVIIAMLVLLFSNSLFMFTLTFVLLQLSVVTLQVSKSAILIEFCKEHDRPTYISISNTLTAPFSFLAPFIGASIATVWGFKTLFISVIGGYVLYTIFLLFFVKDPRRYPKPHLPDGGLKLESDNIWKQT